MLTIQINLFVLYKIKKAYCKSFYTYIWVPEYVPELFFLKLHKENIGKSVFLQKQITTSFRTLTLKKLYFLYVTYTHTQFVNPSLKPGLIYMRNFQVTLKNFPRLRNIFLQNEGGSFTISSLKSNLQQNLKTLLKVF